MKVGCVVVVALLVAGACGDSSSGPVARFDLPASGSIGWGVAPFPSDLFLRDDGTVDLASLPSTSAMWEGVRTELNGHQGFCGTCPIYFPIDGEIDPASLADGVVMIDPSGTKLAVEVEWDAADKLIAVRPHRGIVPRAGLRYIVALTTSVRGIDGSALRAASGFTSPRAKTVTTPALAALGDAGISAGAVVALAAFTVEDPTVLPRDLAARVTAYFAAHGAPTLTVDHVWRASDGTLDALMGIPAEDRPGLDVPSMAGNQGTTGVVHDSIALVIKGRFRSVRVITGAGMELGTLRPDVVDGGDVPFVLAIPTGVDVTHLPVIVFHHGLGGTLSSGLALADMAGKAGAAFLSLETFQHGERAPGATDTSHSLRTDGGALGADGFFEVPALTVGLRLLGLSGAPAGFDASPAYVLGSLSQMVADLHALLDVVHASDLAPIAAADASLTGLAFDRDKVYFVGLSLGTLVGTSTLVADDTVKAAAFNVPVAGLAATLCENKAFRDQLELLGLRLLEIPNGEYEPDLQLTMHPLMGMYQWTLYPLEPAALVKALVAKPRDLFWQLAGLDELAGVPAGDHLISATGMPAIGTYTFAPVSAGTSPLQGRGAYRFPQADHLMAGYSAGSSGVLPPGLPPFDIRPSPLKFTNPTTAVHAQLTHFFQTKRLTGTGEIAAP